MVWRTCMLWFIWLPGLISNCSGAYMHDPLESQVNLNRRFPSCISPLFQSESKCEVFHIEISFIHTQILVHLHVNKTNFHMKGFALWNRDERQLGFLQKEKSCQPSTNISMKGSASLDTKRLGNQASVMSRPHSSQQRRNENGGGKVRCAFLLRNAGET